MEALSIVCHFHMHLTPYLFVSFRRGWMVWIMISGPTEVQRARLFSLEFLAIFSKYMMNKQLKFDPPPDFSFLKRMSNLDNEMGPTQMKKLKKWTASKPHAKGAIFFHCFSQIPQNPRWIKIWNFAPYVFGLPNRMDGSDCENGPRKSLEWQILGPGLFCKFLKICDESTDEIWALGCFWASKECERFRSWFWGQHYSKNWKKWTGSGETPIWSHLH